ncbi:effector-associated constant component EACC1 [[Actinomadura] parvosata]|uniref:effector-associated constant component EACC1 n=1 Tax=[Actinomadura] parvosata TaxID=1955412 RepID=UPI0012BD07A3|nr:hypothetical protein [Nonomuraea sp. ATCC 55076]
MNVMISISANDRVRELASLAAWLQSQRDLQGNVRAVSEKPRERELGGMVELLAVTLSSGGAGLALSRSLVAWLSNRHTDVSITITTESGTIKLDALRTRDALPMLEKILQQNTTGRDD